MLEQASGIPGVIDRVDETAPRRKTIYVYQTPVRVWHWLTVGCVTVLIITGYFIGSPPPTLSGEASAHYLMGNIRAAHFAAGYVLAIGLVCRFFWALVGNRWSRQIFFLPVWDKVWLKGLVYEIKWYLFIVRYPKKYIGHNPAAQASMFCLLLLFTFMICAGFAMYSEGTGRDSWQYAMFGWVFSIFPNSQDVHTFHHLGMWAIVIFVMLHVYAAVCEDIVSRQSTISSIVSGERVFRDDFRDTFRD
jgi:Ni/Fe-hydrogenase 1 B-type cytochrome subunit